MTPRLPVSPSRRIGDFLVVTLQSGFLEVGLGCLANIEPEVAGELDRRSGPPVPGSIHLNAYLVQGQGRNVLIDTGLDHDRLIRSLAALGLAPAAVDCILLTHAHPDHIGGLLDDFGAPGFPNAELVVNSRELAFWQNDGHFERATGRSHDNFRLARQVFANYAARLRAVSTGEVLPGILALDLAGHTAGHTGYRLESAGQALLVWGDVVHFPLIQVAYPEVTVRFDHDPAQAAARRKQVFDAVSEEGVLVAGMHLGCTGFARLERIGERYRLRYEHETSS